MRPRSLFSQLFAAQVVLIVAMVVAGQVSAERAFKQASIEQLSIELETAAQTIVGYLNTLPPDTPVPDYANLLPTWEPAGSLGLTNPPKWTAPTLPGSFPASHIPMPTRITIVEADGRVTLNSEREPAELVNHRDRPEVQQAFAGEVGHSIRWSHSINEEMFYVSVPQLQNGKVIRVVRASRSIARFDSTVRRVRGLLLGGGCFLVLLAALFSYFVARRLTRPIEQMKHAARQFAIVSDPKPLDLPNVEELAVLARALNRVGARVRDQYQEIVDQRNEREAVLAGMVEGVIAVNTEDRVISLNNAACELFGFASSTQVVGQTLQESIRSSGCERITREVIEKGETVWRDVTDEVRQRMLRVSGAPLRDSANDLTGVVLVINDVTQLRRLEEVRRDFVANVSHELKTPLTAIAGFVETLVDGAMNNPEDCHRFLGIIGNHVVRMQRIVDDLLTLSTLEQAGGKQPIFREEVKLKPLIERVVDSVSRRAVEKRITVTNSIPEDFVAFISSSLIEQAVLNLLDNAVKFSDQGACVEIHAAVHGKDEMVLSVRDNGPGIHRHHHARLFERFYRMDMARTRQEGGTGLGLAIVKHIAQGHGGSVSVVSSPGVGSTFVIHLPVRSEQSGLGVNDGAEFGTTEGRRARG